MTFRPSGNVLAFFGKHSFRKFHLLRNIVCWGSCFRVWKLQRKLSGHSFLEKTLEPVGMFPAFGGPTGTSKNPKSHKTGLAQQALHGFLSGFGPILRDSNKDPVDIPGIMRTLLQAQS